MHSMHAVILQSHNNNNVIDPTEPIRYWVKEFELYEDEKRSLLEGGWISDNLITVVQRLLKTSHPLIGGLEPPVLARVFNLEVQRGQFVQVLNVDDSHWVTISNLFCLPGTVNIYNSLPARELSHDTKKQIANIMMNNEFIIVEFIKCQIQLGPSDCGLFALAFASSLCEGVDPGTLKYPQHELRRHIFQCLQNRRILPFPARRRKKKARIRTSTIIEVRSYI